MSAEAKFNGALESTIYRPELSSGCGICRDHDHCAYTGGYQQDSLPMSCSATCKRVMPQLGHGDELKSDVMWLAADVSRIGDLPPLQRRLSCTNSTSSVVQTMTFPVSAGFLVTVKRWYRVGNESCSSGRFVMTATHSLLLGPFSRNSLARTRSELQSSSNFQPSA